MINIEDKKDNTTYIIGVSEEEKNKTKIIFKPIIQENFAEMKDNQKLHIEMPHHVPRTTDWNAFI